MNSFRMKAHVLGDSDDFDFCLRQYQKLSVPQKVKINKKLSGGMVDKLGRLLLE
jgi:hypothetical protein